jgi:hypothetical protein
MQALVTSRTSTYVLLFLAAIIIVAIGIAYTSLLFSWQWLLRAPQIKVFALIRDTRLNSFMDAYLAPHTLKSRYWTGLLLFIRVVIYILSAVNVSGDPNFNLRGSGVFAFATVVFKKRNLQKCSP